MCIVTPQLSSTSTQRDISHAQAALLRSALKHTGIAVRVVFSSHADESIITLGNPLRNLKHDTRKLSKGKARNPARQDSCRSDAEHN